jgi:hypothetical protein
VIKDGLSQPPFALRANGGFCEAKPSNEISDMKTKDIEFNADDLVGSVEASPIT